MTSSRWRRRLAGLGRLITIDEDDGDSAQLLIVVSGRGTDPRPPPDQLTAHVEMDVALPTAAAVVLAGRTAPRSRAPTC